MIASATMTPATTAEAAQHRRLVDAAQQFEGIFLQQMLKPISDMGKEDQAADSSDDGGDSGTLQSYGTEAVAKAISAAGGLGIAREVLAKLAPGEASKQGLSAAGGHTPLKSDLRTPIESGRRLP